MTTAVHTAPDYLLRLGDDALVAAQRLCWWATRAPQLEEDVALANIALDLLGQARALLGHAGRVEGRGRDEDTLAFLRDDRAFTNVQLVELADTDFADAVTRLLFFGVYQDLLYRRLTASTDPVLAAIAVKSAKETAYHVDHAAAWTVRLGDGTEESHRRMRRATRDLWPYTHELFVSDEVFARAATDGTGVDPAGLRAPWRERITTVLTEATLPVPEDGWAPGGGRHGLHTEAFGPLVLEMQGLHRAHPGARW
ncbi:1,2-phenylacetyl-CoA epoxidase subunit PaaC [Streptomyces alanosinicus]|uniref:Phenylacetic acid degradation protein n=1 Tax=Streptomyces alanosinicus TaxID=68171 RepID=A0A919D5T7_9ACTN|nr:1,2-phenylacetyl-CoA epoxidase subunit PaaC [Streptomyces alanosinicus]GHE12648.1 phenylacetic acid degradation protein [Streptomyces alanosinicus]